MKTSGRGFKIIKEFEGYRDSAYQCSAGVWTIGYGHTSGVKKGDTITKDRAESILSQDVRSAEYAVSHNVESPLTQNQFDALVSLIYNIGEGAFAKSTLLKMLNKADYKGAAAQFARWNKAGGKVLSGLVRRRAAEAALFMEGELLEEKSTTVDVPDKSLSKSRTIVGGSVAGVATVASEIITETKDSIEPLVPYAESLKMIFLFISLAAIALTIYARWDDRRKGDM